MLMKSLHMQLCGQLRGSDIPSSTMLMKVLPTQRISHLISSDISYSEGHHVNEIVASATV